MPLSTVLGAQSLIKPGVCTTATRPASPYTGQMIYDTTVLQALVWNGTAWASVGATAGGLVFIGSGSFTASATASLPTNSFTSTYKNYKVIYQLSAVSGANQLRLRFRTAGTDNTAANYDFSEYGRRYGSTTAIVNESTNADNLYLGNSISYSALSIDVLAPQATSQTVMFSTVNGNDTAGDGTFQYNARFTATTSFDAMTLYVSAGTITGTYRVYAYNE